MSTKNTSIVRLSVLGLGALLAGLTGRAALAETPTTAPDAEAKAQDYREQAAYFRSLGGVGYKTGLEQRADADAARYSALAEKLATPPAAAPPAAAPPATTEEASHHCPALKPAVQTSNCEP